MQQGDSLGPLLFCLTIQPFITKLRSDFSIFYLDDGSVEGNVDDVLHDLHLIIEEAAKVDLKLNLMKTELITDNRVRRAVQLAPSSYLASVAGCSNLVQQIIPTSTTSPLDLNIECATHLWSQGHFEQPLSLPSSTHQHLWDAPRVACTYDNLLMDAPDYQAKSHLLAVSCSQSGHGLMCFLLLH